ncbi:hypothetical protein CC80DRAFT_514206 [Byssothecium circinans]|uniref:DNA repair and recombination protein RAD26 n=1 Tax=Byssothecium circinans TaxID=147558 RepID=A0A6A5U4Y6_9PLEO|nr:hypothetical protein CC80DRAFT_514206 [Byssothecium circinans]
MHVVSPEAAQSPAHDTPAVLSSTETNDDNIPVVEDELPSYADEETRLKFLTTGARDQDDIERDIGEQADQLLTEQADERDKKRMERASADIKRNEAAIRKIRNRLAVTVSSNQQVKLRAEVETYQQKIDGLEEELDAIQQRINKRHAIPDGDDSAQPDVNGPLPNETRRDFLLRTGKITPFMQLGQTRPGAADTLGEAMHDAEIEQIVDDTTKGATNHQNLMKPASRDSSATPEVIPRPKKKLRTTHGSRTSSSSPEALPTDSDDAYVPNLNDRQLAALSESNDSEAFVPNDAHNDRQQRKRVIEKVKKVAKATTATESDEDQTLGIDDGNERIYRDRLRKWNKDRSVARRQAMESMGEAFNDDQSVDECYKPHPTAPDGKYNGDFRVPGDIYPALFNYQQTGVEWLWELYKQNVGGILGDEMGLGKTIQTIAFIAGLHYSGKLTKPVLVVCPMTVMTQWVKEFHTWWPALRVSIMHSSGSGFAGSRVDRAERDNDLREHGNDDETLTDTGKAAKKVIEKVKRDGHVLITTYSGVETFREFLSPIEWDSVILDEGHMIRNPDAAQTINCKELRSANRIILSGTPIQNKLSELWSLFDFIYPMRLGTLISFRNQFETPIKLGGYANATNLDFETAMQTAETLKDAISPYLLQRFKADVATDLPDKKEKVLFCKLTRQQREAYERFLASEDMRAIEDGTKLPLFGIDYLRKICNHPDLIDHKTLADKPGYGAPNKSGKIQVVKELVSLWTKNGHKTLIFSQNRITLDILEKQLIGKMPGINYRRMDGETNIKNRQALVDEFNNDPNIHVFLLTTKVGGLGVNLTGANRVIIFDPDWNPSTDIQARERSWRLGQKKPVEIYRLMSAGTIEEKIYHRQIFKQFLTNKVLKDPSQRQTFQMSDLHDLFTLGNEQTNGSTETETIFRHSKARQPPASDATSASDFAAVRGIDHTEAYTYADDETEKKVQGGSDAALMSGIFAKSGVHSIVEHDQIVNGSNKRHNGLSQSLIQHEAKRQAAKAAAELKKNLDLAQRAPIGVATWTGTNGELGRPRTPSPPRARGLRGGLTAGGRGGRGGGGAASSSNVLNNLSARQTGAGGRRGAAGTANSGTPPPAPTTFSGKRMLNLIRQFIISQGGTVPTQMLIDHFDRFVRTSPTKTAEFKAMLDVVAVMEKTNFSQGRGMWKLRDEWKEKGA